MNVQIAYTLLSLIGIAGVGSRTFAWLPRSVDAGQTTQTARQVVLERIEAIARNGDCRQSFGRSKIDFDLLRATVRQTRFYDATGIEGDLKFSTVVGKRASPDQSLKTLARQTSADAFVLGYSEDGRYVRTKRVVLWRGYFEQPGGNERALRPTTPEEKQNLLLHEILHIALEKDDDDLNSRDLCPLKLLAFCSRSALPNPSEITRQAHTVERSDPRSGMAGTGEQLQGAEWRVLGSVFILDPVTPRACRRCSRNSSLVHRPVSSL